MDQKVFHMMSMSMSTSNEHSFQPKSYDMTNRLYIFFRLYPHLKLNRKRNELVAEQHAFELKVHFETISRHFIKWFH